MIYPAVVHAVVSPAVLAPPHTYPVQPLESIKEKERTDNVIVVNTSTPGPNEVGGGGVQLKNPNRSMPSPLYGNLKGGRLPTFRKYQTMKSTKRFHHDSQSCASQVHSGGRRKSTKRREVKKKTVKRTYHLGRNKANNQLSVLIKNQAKNNKIKQEENIIKRKPMSEVKSYLYDKNMIKIGTTAPEVVLRKMYETSILAGDITNQNPKIRLHNFTSYGNTT